MKIFCLNLLLFMCYVANAQVSSSNLINVHNLTDSNFNTLNNTNANSATSGSLGYKASDNKLYYHNGTKWELLSTETSTYVTINEFLSSEPVSIPTVGGDFNGNVTYIVPPEYDGYTVASATYRVFKTGSNSNFTVRLSKNTDGITSSLGLQTATIGDNYVQTVIGGTGTVQTGDAIFMTLPQGTTPATQPKGLACTLKLVKP